jgi:hypothetical protein
MVRDITEDNGFLLDQYYPDVEDLTIPTRFVALTNPEITALIALHRFSLSKHVLTDDEKLSL